MSSDRMRECKISGKNGALFNTCHVGAFGPSASYSQLHEFDDFSRRSSIKSNTAPDHSKELLSQVGTPQCEMLIPIG